MLLMKVKSTYILKRIFEPIKYIKLLDIIRFNKYLQMKLQKDLNDYKEYLKTEIEIIPYPIRNNEYINIEEKDKSFFHFYFNDETKEKKIYELPMYYSIDKVKIIIEYEIKSFNGLFRNIQYIQKIKFIKFNRRDIKSLSSIFRCCKSLKEIDLSNFIQILFLI